MDSRLASVSVVNADGNQAIARNHGHGPIFGPAHNLEHVPNHDLNHHLLATIPLLLHHRSATIPLLVYHPSATNSITVSSPFEGLL
jgi:hypothetical protein